MLSDPETMSYNKGYHLDFPTYHNDTGCIDFPKDEWQSWYSCFIGQEPERYYAYITRLEDDAFLGEVNIHKASRGGYHDMGIVLDAAYRGQGYAAEALMLLLDYAFEKMNISSVRNSFESERGAAVRAHLSAGFTVASRQSGLLELLMTRETFEKNKANRA